MDMKLELVPVPVSDVDRAKAFYVEKVGFHSDLDVRPTDTARVVQLTPPGSACSIVIGTGLGEISDRSSFSDSLGTSNHSYWLHGCCAAHYASKGRLLSQSESEEDLEPK